MLLSSWQSPRTVFYILTRLQTNGAGPPATQENAKASRRSATPVHTCMSSGKSLSEQPAIVAAHCQRGKEIDSVETGCHGRKRASSARAFTSVDPQPRRSYGETKHTECPRTWRDSPLCLLAHKIVGTWKTDEVPGGDVGEEMAAVLSVWWSIDGVSFCV